MAAAQNKQLPLLVVEIRLLRFVIELRMLRLLCLLLVEKDMSYTERSQNLSDISRPLLIAVRAPPSECPKMEQRLTDGQR